MFERKEGVYDNTYKIMKKTLIIAWVIAVILVSIFWMLPFNSEQRSIVTNCSAIKDISFDWDKINSDNMLKFCLLEKAKQLKTIESMSKWLQKEGFSNIQPVSNTPNRVYLNGNWDSEARNSKFPYSSSFLNNWFNKIFSDWYVIQITYENNIPISTNAHHIIL